MFVFWPYFLIIDPDQYDKVTPVLKIDLCFLEVVYIGFIRAFLMKYMIRHVSVKD